MTKPAILHIITRLDLGGAQKSVLALITQLQQNNSDFEVYLISGVHGELVAQTNDLKNVMLLNSLVWEIKPKNFLLELQNFIKLIHIMRKLKKQHKTVILHTHTIKAGTIGRWAGLLAGIQIRIHTIHGFAFHPYQNKMIWLLFYLIELFNSLITTHFICVSSQDLKAGSEIFPQFSKKASIIRAATLLNDFAQSDLRLQPAYSKIVTLGTIASLKPGKNLFELLKAFKFAQKQLKTENIALKLEIVGDGPLRVPLEIYLSHHNLSSSVKITGWTQKPMLYAQNWAGFIFTSLWEGLPCALIEIKALKIPIFAYQVGGLIDLIDQSDLTYPGKWLELAQKITQTFLNAQPPVTYTPQTRQYT